MSDRPGTSSRRPVDCNFGEDKGGQVREVIGSFAGTTLAGRELAIPGDLDDLTLLAFAYQQNQQSDVNTWLRVIDGDDRVRAVEIPLLGRRWMPGRRIINGGMAANMDQPTREQTMCIYTDVPAFKRDVLGVMSDEILAVLVDGDGTVLWHAIGRADPTTMSDLRAVVDDRAPRAAD